MTLRTGRQVNIHNGSTLAFLGVRPGKPHDLEDPDEPITHVEMIAQIQNDHKFPPFKTKMHLVWAYTKAILNLLCAARTDLRAQERILHSHTDEDWLRVRLTTRVNGEIRNPDTFLRNFARSFDPIWEAVQYSECGGDVENFPLSDTSSCPIQPHMVHIAANNGVVDPKQLHPLGWDPIPLGFGTEDRDRVAFELLMLARSRGGWGPFEEDCYDEWASSSSMTCEPRVWRSSFNAAFFDLIRDEYISHDEEGSRYYVHETFVTKCWRASLRIPEGV